MSGDQGRPQGERIAALEATQRTDGQSIRDLWEALKEEAEARDKLAGRVSKAELFLGRVGLLMTIGGALGLAIFAATMAYINNLLGRH